MLQRTTEEKDKDRDVRVGILIQASTPAASEDDKGSFRWSNAVSFIEVKAKDDVDWRDRLLLQISRYAVSQLNSRYCIMSLVPLFLSC
jgi:hypothetical protein